MRMQIEEEFRDIKNSLFGLVFGHHKSRYVHRIEVIILSVTRGSITADIYGLGIIMVGVNRRYKANIVKTSIIISFMRIAKLLLYAYRDAMSAI